MRNNETFKLRVPTADLESWRARAGMEAKSLSAWIRGRCNALTQEVTVVPTESVPTKHKTAKTCAHGYAKGYHCGLCGGVAKIDR